MKYTITIGYQGNETTPFEIEGKDMADIYKKIVSELQIIDMRDVVDDKFDVEEKEIEIEEVKL